MEVIRWAFVSGVVRPPSLVRLCVCLSALFELACILLPAAIMLYLSSTVVLFCRRPFVRLSWVHLVF